MREIKIAPPRSMTDFPQMAYWLVCVEVWAPAIMCAVFILLPLLQSPDALTQSTLVDVSQWIFLTVCFFFAANPVFFLLKKTRALQQETRTLQQQVDQLREKMAILRNEDLDLS